MIDKKIYEEVIAFSRDRDWEQYHTGKDLAVSLVLEASELLEVYQWSGSDQWENTKKEKIEEELADILMYVILITDAYKLDLNEILKSKLEVNNKKYPLEISKGRKEKYDELKRKKK